MEEVVYNAIEARALKYWKEIAPDNGSFDMGKNVISLQLSFIAGKREPPEGKGVFYRDVRDEWDKKYRVMESVDKKAEELARKIEPVLNKYLPDFTIGLRVREIPDSLKTRLEMSLETGDIQAFIDLLGKSASDEFLELIRRR